jgi:hypothetical protein
MKPKPTPSIVQKLDKPRIVGALNAGKQQVPEEIESPDLQ